jgi:hypothetical protein
MSYNTDHLRTAGKITVYTAVLGIAVFAVIFIFNVGEKSIKHAVAQDSATTTVTVVNTPPYWTASTTEVTESSTTTPTNVGNNVTWTAIGTDSNAEDYYLLICSTNATPTANSNAPPQCGAGATQWAVSASTTSGMAATAATTTTADAPFSGESFPWFGYICDGNSGTPRCNNTPTQGTNATNSSPFEVNHRPTFTVFVDDSPRDPGQVVTFTSTSSDADVSGTADTVKLIVCSTNSFNTTTDTCNALTLASSTVFVSANASSTYTISIPTQDQNYDAFGFVIDNHGFEAQGGAQGTNSIISVNNVAPTVSGATVSLAQGTTTNLILTTEAGQTTGFALSFVTADNNSCDAAGGGSADEIVDYDLSLYRSAIGSSTCSVNSSSYDPNNCYPSGVPTSTWNLTCTASSTTCSGSSDTDMLWTCTFPLWYIADPTDGTSPYSAQNWLAQVRGIDDDAATGALGESTVGGEVLSFLAFALNTLTIPYGALEPGQQSDPLVATTTIAATGNVGLDKEVTGESMCPTYTPSTPCPNSLTSTIPVYEQVFATGTVAYAAGTPLSSSTAQEIEINVPKSISTSTPTTSNAYWGIRVPSAITVAGAYTGENTFYAILGETNEW